MDIDEPVAVKARLNKPMQPAFLGLERLRKAMQPDILGLERLRRAMQPDILGLERLRRAVQPDFTGLEVMRRALQPDFTGLEVMRRALQPDFTGLEVMRRALQPDFTGLEVMRRALQPDFTGLEVMRRALQPDFTGLEVMRRALQPDFTRLRELLDPNIEGERLKNTGWFPHYTMPRHILREHLDDAEFDDQLLTYYHENWLEVRQRIEEKLSTYLVDINATATFREALSAHENGNYRLINPTLFAEVERVVRVELFGGMVGSIPIKRGMDESFSKLPLRVFPDRSLGFVGFRQLTHHLYEQIKDDTGRERFLKDPLPNRHASIHGWWFTRLRRPVSTQYS